MPKNTRATGPSGPGRADDPVRPSNSIAAVVVSDPATAERPDTPQVVVWVGGATRPASMNAQDLWFPSGGYGSMSYSDEPDLVAELLAEDEFYVAHRGCGDEAPEHSPAAYRQALSRGYAAVEMSGQATIDGVAVGLHDTGSTSLERTTSLSGDVRDTSLAQVQASVIDYGSTWLGAGWATAQPLPILGQELALWYRRGVVFLEPKADTTIVRAAATGFPECGKFVIWKFARPNTGLGLPTHAQLARAAGMRLWIYLEDSDTTALVDEIADLIGPDGGALGLPYSASDSLIEHAVANEHGLPVIVHPIKRRHERDRCLGLGVRGLMCTNISYVSVDTAKRTEDSFAGMVRSPGNFPGNETKLPTFPAAGEVSLVTGTDSSLSLGEMCPVPNAAGTSGGYKITWDMKWPTLPSATLHADLYFGHVDDTRYSHQITSNVGGYHTVMRANGQLSLFRHDPGTTTGTQLGGSTISTATPVADTWMSFEAVVTDTQITLRRVDDASATITSSDTTYRGGYIGVCQASADQLTRFRNIVVTEL